MSEIRNAKIRAEITVRNMKTGKVSVLVGRYGQYFECYGYAKTQGFVLIQYTALK